MAKTFYSQRLDVPPPQPTEEHTRLRDARAAAQSFTAQGGGRRVAVYTVSGSDNEYWFAGVRTHHYTRSGRCVIDDRAVYHRQLAAYHGDAVATMLIEAVEAGRALAR
jgi:hypothetical protein